MVFRLILLIILKPILSTIIPNPLMLSNIPRVNWILLNTATIRPATTETATICLAATQTATIGLATIGTATIGRHFIQEKKRLIGQVSINKTSCT